MLVLGVNGGLSPSDQDPGAALAVDGRIVAACEEERYVRVASAPGYFPLLAIRACLALAHVRFADMMLVVVPATEGVVANIRQRLDAAFGPCPPVEAVDSQLAHAARIERSAAGVAPFEGDRGLAIGCAYLGAAKLGHGKWQLWDTFLGSCYTDAEIREALECGGTTFEVVGDPCQRAAELLAFGLSVGWYQGRSEAGGRALGNRSILSPLKVKRGDTARIAVLAERAGDWLQAATGPTRVQTVTSSSNELFYDLLARYSRLSGVPAVAHHDLALPGQPLAESPADALEVLRGSDLDALVIGDCVATKGRSAHA